MSSGITSTFLQAMLVVDFRCVDVFFGDFLFCIFLFNKKISRQRNKYGCLCNTFNEENSHPGSDVKKGQPQVWRGNVNWMRNELLEHWGADGQEKAMRDCWNDTTPVTLEKGATCSRCGYNCTLTPII